MDAESRTSTSIGRRARKLAAALAVSGLAAGFAACGDDEQADINDQIDEAQEQVSSALENVDTDELQSQAEEALDEIDTEELKKQAEEAQKQLDQLGN